MPNDFPRSYIRALIAEDDAERDKAAALQPRVVQVETEVASVTAISEARIRLHPDEDAWRAYAACADTVPGLFFPGPHENGAGLDARQVCDGCPVRVECLEFALEHDERFGIWGGTSERERRRLRRQRRTA